MLTQTVPARIAGHPVGELDVARPDAGREPEPGVVRQPDGIVGHMNAMIDTTGPEDSSRAIVIWRTSTKTVGGRSTPGESGSVGASPPATRRRPRRNPGATWPRTVPMRGRDERPDLRARVERIPDAKSAPRAVKRSTKASKIGRWTSSATGRAISPWSRTRRTTPRPRVLEGRIGEDDVGRLAAELERDALEVAGGLRRDLLADLGRAGERDLVDVDVLDQVIANGRIADHHVEHAGRQARLLGDLAEPQGRQRRVRGGLDDIALPAGRAGAMGRKQERLNGVMAPTRRRFAHGVGQHAGHCISPILVANPAKY
jgi:hypothetical protein